jgi:hypothetical protein
MSKMSRKDKTRNMSKERKKEKTTKTSRQEKSGWRGSSSPSY